MNTKHWPSILDIARQMSKDATKAYHSQTSRGTGDRIMMSLKYATRAFRNALANATDDELQAVLSRWLNRAFDVEYDEPQAPEHGIAAAIAAEKSRRAYERNANGNGNVGRKETES